MISFVIPVYKKPPEVFEKCLASLFDQSFKDFEVIAVFDGEDKELELVARRYPKVLCFTTQHGGGSKARNFGMDMSDGTFVWWWDADCYIKPDHAKRMMDEFKATDADFVYSGYDFATEGIPPMTGESFDVFSLQCGNYISSMAPIRRTKAHRWDETLEAAQDWDYWLTAAERGLKGVWVEGSGFITDTHLNGLSSDKWSSEHRDNTIYTVRRKHGIPDRTVGVYSMQYPERACKLAQILDADFIKPTGPTPTVYKTIFNLDYNRFSRFEGIASDVLKIQYWLPGFIEALKNAQYRSVMETIRIAKGVTNYCGTQYEQAQLSEVGITAEVLPLPLAESELKKVSTALPEKFTILLATDESYADLLKDFAVDLPHIDFKYNAAKTTEYSCFVSFYQFAALDNAMLMAQVNGRHVISNVQAPYCGFIDPDQNWEQFKKELYDKVRTLKDKPLNQEAQAYYLEFANPAKFKETICHLEKTAMEVI